VKGVGVKGASESGGGKWLAKTTADSACSNAARGYGEGEPAHVIAAGSWPHASPHPHSAVCFLSRAALASGFTLCVLVCP
jgi:hypothetical protein